MSKKELLMTLALLMLIIFSIYLFFYEEKVNNYFENKDKETFKKMTIDCIVKQKFINKKNHSSRTIQFNNCEDLIIIVRDIDTSSFYDFVKSKDSVVKIIDSDIIMVYREGLMYNFKVYKAIKD